ncbi:MAG TPA: cell division protein SepF [Chthonomonadaceae bacterium]|nr:cell division protein SepF [Chthonomonadaceae bacterium]
MNAQPMPEDYEPKKGFWSRVTNGLFGTEEAEEEEMDIAATPGKAQQPLRLQSARGHRVSVRRNAQVFEDAKLAADGLKGGEHQIVNLERATPQMAERIIDFLNGVCYALDGTVERVGEKVYMFVPANVSVEIDEGVTAANSGKRSTFGDIRE